jgi:hypothetical protein
MPTLEVTIRERLAEADYSQRAAVVQLLKHVAQKVGDHVAEGGDIVYDGRRVGSWRYGATK